MRDLGYTLLGVARDGSHPTVEFCGADSLGAAMREARTFLDEHDSCAVVEIWRDGARLASVHTPGRESALPSSSPPWSGRSA